ncbi:hypothetical protein CLOP_g20856 [Closterium sp. NIES-67]|nr:hypothetical protein CLOP_g20856 [Closterium sp. NIES-67]
MGRTSLTSGSEGFRNNGSSSTSNLYHVVRDIKRAESTVYNALRSILLDASFVREIHSLWPTLPLLPNLRCGLWYAPPDDVAATCYFKSTDGHTGNWDFSVTRMNLHVANIAARSGGAMIVDATRRGKVFPDSLSKTIPIWACVVNRAGGEGRAHGEGRAQGDALDRSKGPEQKKHAAVGVTSQPQEATAREGCHIPLEQSPWENAPWENSPGENAPGENAPAENAPGENVPGENAPWDDALHLPRWVSSTEQASIEQRIDAWVERLLLVAPPAAIDRLAFGEVEGEAGEKGEGIREGREATGGAGEWEGSRRDSNSCTSSSSATTTRTTSSTTSSTTSRCGRLQKPLRVLWVSQVSLIWTNEVPLPDSLPFTPLLLVSASAPSPSGCPPPCPSLLIGAEMGEMGRIWGGEREKGAEIGAQDRRSKEGERGGGGEGEGNEGERSDSDNEGDGDGDGDDDDADDGDDAATSWQDEPWTYIQGAGDDEESWARGLTPQLFWRNWREVLGAGRRGCNAAVAGVVERERVRRQRRGEHAPQVRVRERGRKERGGVERGGERCGGAREKGMILGREVADLSGEGLVLEGTQGLAGDVVKGVRGIDQQQQRQEQHHQQQQEQQQQQLQQQNQQQQQQQQQEKKQKEQGMVGSRAEQGRRGERGSSEHAADGCSGATVHWIAQLPVAVAAAAAHVTPSMPLPLAVIACGVDLPHGLRALLDSQTQEHGTESGGEIGKENDRESGKEGGNGLAMKQQQQQGGEGVYEEQWHLYFPLKSSKYDRLCIARHVPAAVAFARKHLALRHRLLLICPDGVDLSVCICAALLLALPQPLAHPSSAPAAPAAPVSPSAQSASSPHFPLTKDGLKACLAFLCSHVPAAMPSRGNLKQVLQALLPSTHGCVGDY